MLTKNDLGTRLWPLSVFNKCGQFTCIRLQLNFNNIMYSTAQRSFAGHCIYLKEVNGFCC